MVNLVGTQGGWGDSVDCLVLFAFSHMHANSVQFSSCCKLCFCVVYFCFEGILRWNGTPPFCDELPLKKSNLRYFPHSRILR